MIEFRWGNLIEENADALVNTVNCVGVMGKGIALQFKQAFPDNYRDYERACERGVVRLGQVFVHSTGRIAGPRFIINFPTKNHWRAASRLADIRTGLHDLVRVVRQLEIMSLAVPPLGCGHGGLDWGDVYPLIEETIAAMPDVRVIVFGPQPVPAPDRMPVGTKKPTMTRSRALMILLIDRYRGPGYRLTKLDVQKLAYFLQEAGEELRLNFVKHKFGPYAENLNHALRNMEGHFIRGFGDRSSTSSIHPLPGAVDEAESFLADDNDARRRLDAVADLIAGFEDPHGLELLASIHWVAKTFPDAAGTAEAATGRVHRWTKRKRTLFPPDHIAKGWRRLVQRKWLNEGTPANQSLFADAD